MLVGDAGPTGIAGPRGFKGRGILDVNFNIGTEVVTTTFDDGTSETGLLDIPTGATGATGANGTAPGGTGQQVIRVSQVMMVKARLVQQVQQVTASLLYVDAKTVNVAVAAADVDVTTAGIDVD